MEIIVLIFIKLKLILSRKIILIVVKKLKQLGNIFIAWDSFKKNCAHSFDKYLSIYPQKTFSVLTENVTKTGKL